ncbi:MAG: pimeloyl-ACP methyl ester carboxylesterase [Myxococcota bacterium]|jgi:pimeloyl-ACP methyl ester carboxylesterase
MYGVPVPQRMFALRLTRSPYKLQARQYRRKFQGAGLIEHQIALPSASVRCWIGGEGPPLLLLQGFGANATWQWHGQVDHFASSRRLLVPDLLHFGGSVPRKSDCTLEAQVSMIRELLDHQGIARCDVVGVSYGGFVALGLAHEHPDRVRRAVFVDSPGIGYTEDDYQAMLSTFSVKHIGDLLLPRDPEGLRRLLQIAWHRPPWTPSFALPDVHRNLFEDRVAEKRSLLDNLLKQLRGPEQVSSLSQRTMVVWGRHDPLFPVALGARMAARLGNRSELAVLDASAHTPNMEEIGGFNRLVDGFIRR